MTQLADFDCWENQLTALPPSIADCTNRIACLCRLCLCVYVCACVRLCVCEWELRLPTCVCSPRLPRHSGVSLRSLLAASNAIAAYPDGLSRLTALQRLNFFTNKLTALPPLATLTNLMSLTLRNNQIATLPAYIPPLPLYVPALGTHLHTHTHTLCSHV